MNSSWKEVKLVDYYTISSGLSIGASEFGEGFPFLSFKEVFNNFFVPDKLTQLVKSNEKERINCSIKKGDVFLTRTSETIEELGMSCVALKDYEEATFNGFTKRLRPKNTKDIDPIYIGFYLRSPQFRAEITAYSSLITRASLNNGNIQRLRILLPPLTTQRKIASILSAYDDLIENNLKRIKLLEELAQRTYEEWFIKFRVKSEELKVDKETGLPVGWAMKRLSYFFDVKTGKKDANYGTSNGQYPFFTCSQEPIKAPYYSFDGSAILLAGNGEFNVKIYRGKFEAYQRTYVLIPFDTINISILYRALKSNLKYLTGGSKGAVIKYLTKDMIENFEVIYPSKNILDEFNSISLPIIAQTETLLNQNLLLKEARDILLPRLMSGEIEV